MSAVDLRVRELVCLPYTSSSCTLNERERATIVVSNETTSSLGVELAHHHTLFQYSTKNNHLQIHRYPIHIHPTNSFMGYMI